MLFSGVLRSWAAGGALGGFLALLGAGAGCAPKFRNGTDRRPPAAMGASQFSFAEFAREAANIPNPTIVGVQGEPHALGRLWVNDPLCWAAPPWA